MSWKSVSGGLESHLRGKISSRSSPLVTEVSRRGTDRSSHGFASTDPVDLLPGNHDCRQTPSVRHASRHSEPSGLGDQAGRPSQLQVRGRKRRLKGTQRMKTQRFVDDCYAEYSQKGLVPGSRDCDLWELAHHPVPKCKGGSETVWLLKEHHALHNLLQSEEFDYPCVYGWERNYVSEAFAELAEKWISAQRSIAGKSGNPNGKAKGGKAVGLLNRRRSTNNLSKEVLSLGGKRGSSASNAQKWRCTVSGHVSNPGGLTSWQRKRGICTSNRERIS